MNLIVSILIAFPLGFFVPSRLAAQVSYAALYLFFYVSTAVILLIEWTAGSTEAFGPFPGGDDGQVLSFVLISAVVFGLGALLVHAGSVVRRRRASRHAAGVDVAVA
jgi:hypothetical protein